MKKKLSILLLFLTFFYLQSQKYDYPFVNIRPNKQFAIKCLEILPRSIMVEMVFKCPFYWGHEFSVNNNLYIETSTGEKAKLIKADGAPIEPLKLAIKENQELTFKLYFEKIEDLQNKRFTLRSERFSPAAPYFFDIILDKKESESLMVFTDKYALEAKSSDFLKNIPIELWEFYLLGNFIKSNKAKQIFEDLIEMQASGKLGVKKSVMSIKQISSEEISYRDGNADAYTIVSNKINDDHEEESISSYYFEQGKTSDRVNTCMIWFNNKDKAKEFYDKVCDWYGVTMTSADETHKALVDSYKERVLIIELSDRDYMHTVDLSVLTYEEYGKFRKGK